MEFRKDINGLRAIAVLPVLLFHAQVPSFSGGFLGVDVFFVISGFLITSLILKDLNQKQFSLLSFYNRRARRILPALFFTCLITSCFAFFFMLPYDLRNYGQSLFATTLSANNILLYLTSGYWNLAAEFKPLYHTWSLAIEEQYYFIIPILLLLVYKEIKPAFKTTLFIIAILFLISFYFSFSSTNKELNFLMIGHRMWELLAGSICALLLPTIRLRSNFLALIGLLGIVFSYLSPYAISNNQAVYTLIPVVGSMMIILFSSNQLALGKFLSIKPLSFIGLTSYSIYLLHMPLLAFLRLSTEGQASINAQLIAVFMAIPLAYISWRFIEKPFKDQHAINNKLFFTIIFSCAFLFLTVGYTLHKTYGLQTLNHTYNSSSNFQQYIEAPRKLIRQRFTNPDNKNLLVIGNSFARDVINMLTENQIQQDYEIIYQESFDINSLSPLIDSADVILITSSHNLSNNLYPDSVRSKSSFFYQKLQATGHKNYYLIGTKNFGFNNNFIVRKSKSEAKSYYVKPNQTAITFNQIEASIWQGRYIDIFSVLLNEEQKVPIFTDSQKLISFDTNHLTPDGATYVGSLLLKNSKLSKVLEN